MFDSSYMIIRSLPAKMYESSQSILISHWAHEKILMSAFSLIAQKEVVWITFSESASFLEVTPAISSGRGGDLVAAMFDSSSSIVHKQMIVRLSRKTNTNDYKNSKLFTSPKCYTNIFLTSNGTQ